MPVPWPLDRQRAFIPNIAERALTVKQLFDLHSFLQRLCKAKLLKKFPASNKVYLQWHDLNLYQVRDEVIKPVICFREGVETKGYSWAELVAKGPQPPQLMISHWWGGRFVDFMSAIDKIANRRPGNGGSENVCQCNLASSAPFGLKNRSWFENASLVHTHLVERICITGRCPCFWCGQRNPRPC